MKKSPTKRQLEVLRLLVRGNSNKEVAVKLGLSPKTIDQHRAWLNYKLEVDGPIALCRVALRDKLVSLEDFFASQIGENQKHCHPNSGKFYYL